MKRAGALVGFLALLATFAFLLVQIDTSPTPITEGEIPRETPRGGSGVPNTHEHRNHGDVVLGPQQPPEERNPPREDNDRNDKTGYNWQKVQALAEIGLLVLAAVGGYFIFAQLVAVFAQLSVLIESNRQTKKHNERTLAAMQESNKLTRDAMIAASRAQVAFEELPRFTPNHMVPLRVNFRIHNSGHTAARDITLLTGLWVDERPEPEDWDEDLEVVDGKYKDLAASVFLTPGGSIPLSSCEPIKLEQRQVEALKAGRLYLFFVARIGYDDGFGERRATQYFTVYDPRVDRFSYCDSGNSFT